MLPIDAVDKVAKFYPDRTAAVDEKTTLTFRNLQNASMRIARALQAHGLDDRSSVGIYSPNRARVFEIILGVWRRGATWNPISATNTVASNVSILSRAGTKLLFIDPVFFPLVASIRQELPELMIVSMDGKGPCDYSWEEFVRSEADYPAWQNAQGNPDKTLMVLGTGGTTGEPKLVVETARVWNAMKTVFDKELANHEKAKQLVTAPVTHAAGILALLGIAQGQTIYFHDGFNAPAVLDAIEHDKITMLFLPPTAFYDVVDEQKKNPRDVSSMQNMLIAAAPVSPERLAEGAKLFNWSVSQCFGQAEAPMFVSFQSTRTIREAVETNNETLLKSCGHVTDVVAVSIRDPEGHEVPTGERGEVCVRGSLVADCYLNNPSATSTAHKNGWLHTGDVGSLDCEGRLYIHDRIKDMIISGGFNVFATEVEAALLQHPKVARTAVVGLPDDRWGERVTAVVVPLDGFNDAENLIAFVKERLGSVKAPKEIRWADELPQTAVGKINKVVLRKQLAV